MKYAFRALDTEGAVVTGSLDIASEREARALGARTLVRQGNETWAHDLAELEAETKMAYITSIERSGIEKGILRGEARGKKQLLQNQLQAKFGPAYTDARRRQLEQANTNSLEAWSLRLLTAETIDQVFQDPE